MSVIKLSLYFYKGTKTNKLAQSLIVIKRLTDENIAHLLVQDECMICDYQAVQHTWFLRGKQCVSSPHVRQASRHETHRCTELRNRQSTLYRRRTIRCRSLYAFSSVCVLKQYPTGKIVMVLDNACIHHAHLIQPFPEENRDQLELVFLPPYSQKMNLIEGLWKWLRAW